MAKKNQIVKIAFRQLTAKKRQLFLTTSGIAVGVMVLITSISLMDGIVKSFVEKIIDNTPHIIVSYENITPVNPDVLIDTTSGVYVNFYKNVEKDEQEAIKNYQGISRQISKNKNIVLVSPVVVLNEIGRFGTVSQPLRIHGIIPSIEDKIEQFSKNMVEGDYSSLEKTPDGIILGSTLAKEITAKKGDRIQITSASGNLISVRVTGVFSTGLNEVDNNCYINLRLGQIIGGFREDEVSKLYLRVSDLSQNTNTARGIEKSINHKAATWEENAASFLSLFKMITMIVYFLTFFVILVAGLSVANVLITTVLEKVRDIAILKSIGFKKGEVTSIFIIQGLTVAILGAILGCLLGYIMIEILASIPVQGSKTAAIRSDRLAMGRSIWYFVFASGFAIVISFLASLAPSKNAAKVNPVNILRGER